MDGFTAFPERGPRRDASPLEGPHPAGGPAPRWRAHTPTRTLATHSPLLYILAIDNYSYLYSQITRFCRGPDIPDAMASTTLSNALNAHVGTLYRDHAQWLFGWLRGRRAAAFASSCLLPHLSILTTTSTTSGSSDEARSHWFDRARATPSCHSN